MKKLVAALTIVFMLFQCLPAVTLASDDDATDRVSALEFCELYAKRIMEFNENYAWNNEELDAFVTSSGAFDNGDTFGAACMGGFLDINKTDLTIESLTTTIMDMDAEAKEGHNVLLKALISISALEMSDIEAEGLELLHDIDPSRPADVFRKYLIEYSDIIQPALSSNLDKLEAGDDVLVYQGNYDYYAKSIDYPDVGKMIYLFAQARD